MLQRSPAPIPLSDATREKLIAYGWLFEEERLHQELHEEHLEKTVPRVLRLTGEMSQAIRDLRSEEFGDALLNGLNKIEREMRWLRQVWAQWERWQKALKTRRPNRPRGTYARREFRDFVLLVCATVLRKGGDFTLWNDDGEAKGTLPDLLSAWRDDLPPGFIPRKLPYSSLHRIARIGRRLASDQSCKSDSNADVEWIRNSAIARMSRRLAKADQSKYYKSDPTFWS